MKLAILLSLLFIVAVIVLSGKNLIGIANILASFTQQYCKDAVSVLLYQGTGSNKVVSIQVDCPSSMSGCKIIRYYKDVDQPNYDNSVMLGDIPGGTSKTFQFYQGDLDVSKVVMQGYVCLVECPDGSIHYKGECPVQRAEPEPTGRTTNPITAFLLWLRSVFDRIVGIGR